MRQWAELMFKKLQAIRKSCTHIHTKLTKKIFDFVRSDAAPASEIKFFGSAVGRKSEDADDYDEDEEDQKETSYGSKNLLEAHVGSQCSLEMWLARALLKAGINFQTGPDKNQVCNCAYPTEDGEQHDLQFPRVETTWNHELLSLVLDTDLTAERVREIAGKVMNDQAKIESYDSEEFIWVASRELPLSYAQLSTH